MTSMNNYIKLIDDKLNEFIQIEAPYNLFKSMFFLIICMSRLSLRLAQSLFNQIQLIDSVFRERSSAAKDSKAV